MQVIITYFSCKKDALGFYSVPETVLGARDMAVRPLFFLSMCCNGRRWTIKEDGRGMFGREGAVSSFSRDNG